jgi:hypothetical protein
MWAQTHVSSIHLVFAVLVTSSTMTAAVLDALLNVVDAALEQASVPPISPYWRAEAERFYGHESALLLVEMVGRGGDKSRTSTKMAIAEVLAGDFAIPRGERHYFTHVAENRDEAAKTLGVLENYLKILRVKFSRAGDTIELADMPRGFKVLACRIGAVSGWRCIGWTADECAKWNNDGADPSAEVIASIRAMTVTHPKARGRMFSSPLGILGNFYDTWALGQTHEQVAGHAATWLANPSVTEEHTRKLERNERKWKREYAAIPTQETDESMFSATLLERATRDGPCDVPREPGVSYVAAQDPGFVENAWTFVVAAKRWVGGRVKRSIVLAREWRGTAEEPLNPEWVLQQMKPLCEKYGVDVVESDAYERFSLQAIGERVGLYVRVGSRSAVERLGRYESLITWLSDHEVDLPPDRQLRADLLAVQQHLTSNGFTIRMPQTPDGRHADYAPSVTLALSSCKVDPAALPVAMTNAERELARVETQLAKEYTFTRQRRENPGKRLVVDQPVRRTSSRRFW